jgi:hypothetical protein
MARSATHRTATAIDEYRQPNYGRKKKSFLGEMFDFD